MKCFHGYVSEVESNIDKIIVSFPNGRNKKLIEIGVQHLYIIVVAKQDIEFQFDQKNAFRVIWQALSSH